MKPLSQKIRLHYLDRGKAVAMLFVVFGHINLFCIYGNEMINGCKVSNYTSILQLTLFMFLSGIVVSTEGLTIREGGNVILKKGKQLLIPFFVVGSIFAYFFCKKDIWSLIYNSPKLGYWYLWVLFLFYITHILYQVIICNANRSIVKDLLYGGGIFCLLKGAVIMLPVTAVSFMSLELAASLYPAFYIGVLVRRYELHDILFSNSKIYLLGLVAVLSYILFDIYGFRYHGGLIMFQYGFIIILLNILKKTETINNIINRFLSFIGKNTLDIYIYHYFILQMCKMLWLGKLLGSQYSPLLEIFVTGILTLLVATISVYIGKILKEGFQLKNLSIR